MPMLAVTRNSWPMSMNGRAVAARVTFFRGEERDWDGEIEEIEERVTAGDFRQQHDELVAAEACDRVAVADTGFQPDRHLPQQLIAGLVPE